MDEIRAFTLLTALELEQIHRNKLSSTIERTRDTKTDQMEREVFSKLAQYSRDNTPAPSAKGSKQLPSDNKLVSPEEAMEELRKMGAL
jgi:uncharacterized protein with WD repeat